MALEPDPPLVRSTPDVRHAVWQALVRAGFTEEALQGRPGWQGVEFAGDDRYWKQTVSNDASDPQAWLARLFLSGARVAADSAATPWLDAVERDAFLRTDLVRWATPDGPAAQLIAPVMLAPMSARPGANGPTFVAADRLLDAEGARRAVPVDVVFTGHNPLTRQFLGLLPRAPIGGDALDLCTGGGVAALWLSGVARQVVAADLTSRAVHFARFNAWLNDTTNIEVAEGDLFDAVGSRRFQFICAHPPYVPTLRQTAIFRDGGALGDSVTRRFVAGVSDHLHEGGHFFVLCMAMDAEDGRFEARARGWLGADGNEFDLIMAVDHMRSPEEFADYVVQRTMNPEPDEKNRWLEVLGQHRVSQIVYGALVGRKLAPGAAGQTRRVKLDRASTFESFRWLLDRLAASRAPSGDSGLVDSALRLAKGAQLEVTHHEDGGRFVPARFRLSNAGSPFPCQIDTDGFVADLLARAARHRTFGEAVAEARKAGHLPPEFNDEDAVRVAAYMFERGLLEPAER